MSSIPLKKNWGKAAENSNPLLVRQLDEMYTDFAGLINQKVKRHVVNGQSATANNEFNRSFEIGDFWIRVDTNEVWIMTSRTNATVVNWKLL
jgi:hypothetical protein